MYNTRGDVDELLYQGLLGLYKIRPRKCIVNPVVFMDTFFSKIQMKR